MSSSMLSGQPTGKKQSILAGETRNRVLYEILSVFEREGYPLTFRDICRSLSICPATVNSHVNTLVKEGKLIRVKGWARGSYWPAGQPLPSQMLRAWRFVQILAVEHCDALADQFFEENPIQ